MGKEKGILFKGEMVRALLNTKPDTWPAEPIDPSRPWKWQTRRLVKPQSSMRFAPPKPPPYRVGNILWVRETWGIGARPHPAEGCVDGIEYRADCHRLGEHDLLPLHPIPEGIDVSDVRQGRWIPGIHMFRWASRIDLEVMEVRAQRLQDISEEDAKAEGCVEEPCDDNDRAFKGGSWTAKLQFMMLWDSINGEDAFRSNPWIWAYSLKRIR